MRKSMGSYMASDKHAVFLLPLHGLKKIYFTQSFLGQYSFSNTLNLVQKRLRIYRYLFPKTSHCNLQENYRYLFTFENHSPPKMEAIIRLSER